MQFNPNTVPVQPIASLTPYLGGKQWIKARVVDKSDVRTWSKPGSTGKLFSCTLVDDTASIRATFFNDSVDSFYQQLNSGQVYFVGGGSIKTANRKFSNVNNEYEMTIEKDTQIHLARDAATNIPMQRYNFIPIIALQSKEENSPVDILAIVTKVSAPSKIITKAKGEELVKREVTVSDQSSAVDMTFWGSDAAGFNYDVGAVLALRNVKVRHFSGVTLTFSRDSGIDPNPNIPDTQLLHKWYTATGGIGKSLSGQRGEGGDFGNNLGPRYFRQVETEGLGRGEKADFVVVACVPTFIKTDSVWYEACKTCNKKVIQQGDRFRCEKCNSIVNCEARYMCSIQCSDGVTSKWLTLFNESGETFWGCSAQALKLEAQADSSALTTRAQLRLHKPVLLTIRVKEERAQNVDGAQFDDRLRLTVSKVTDLGYPSTDVDSIRRECERLVETINAYHN